MTYSCGIYDTLDGDLTSGGNSQWSGGQGLTRLSTRDNPASSSESSISSQHNATTDELYEAQMRKLHHIIRKARIQPGNRVLEIGSGWGSLSILIAQTVPNTTIDTLTLSVQQQVLAQERIREAGLEDRVTVHLMDYRNMPQEWQGRFDRVVSVEMIEAVGMEFLEGYWKVVDWALTPHKGVGVVQVITIPEPSTCSSHNPPRRCSNVSLGFERYLAEIDFIRKWVSFQNC